MAFKYSCFISYHQCEHDLGKRFVEDLYEALSGELEMCTGNGMKVYLDVNRLSAGYFHNEQLARDLCRSVCMVVVYTPNYFDLEKTYCAREYQAMLGLEEKRLPLLGGQDHDTRGLVIPIVVRGWESLPGEIKNKRFCCNFSGFQLRGARISRHSVYAPEITKVAQYIWGRCRAFEEVAGDPCCDCEDFALPSKEEIMPWLVETVRKIPFPGCEVST